MQQELRGLTPAVRQSPPGAAHASRTARFWRSWPGGLTMAVIAGAFLAAVGAFGTGDSPAPVRFSYWIGLMAGGSVIGVAVAHAAERRGLFDRRPAATVLGLALVMSAPMTVIVWVATAWVYGMPMTVRSLLWFFPPVLLVGAAMTSISYLIHRRSGPPASPVPAAPAPPKFLERLPLKLRGADLYAVEAEDHYLRLHTSRGSDLILMRLADAVAELEGLEGAQTHRSWWVAKTAVVDARAGDGRATLTLVNGVEAPVSRRYAPALRQARWW